MLTQCSHCKKTYSLSIEELRSAPTMLYCPHCEEMLGRLNIFQASFFRSGENNSPHSLLWAAGFLASVLLFLTQLYLLQRDEPDPFRP